MNNDELIAAGHELAKCLDSNTPLLDIAKMIVSLADKLGVTTAALREKTKQCEQLAEECAALKDINKWCKTDAFKNMYREFKTAESLGCQDVDCMHDAMLTAIMHAPETPATDAFLREVRASAVDAVCLKISNSIVSCRQDEMIGLDEAVNIASDFAVELRQGGAA
ncbi:hypothetical protein MKT17_000948 [Cronobacter sakazakii]|nr:hypothetical protein [Cronobacter sakazakii]EIX1762627.1 hypothetical protein [Cronobacter sakazakii]EIX6119790.1 hypothetical protein [Cronobacter sakazakii]EIX6209495.1 hypothetical protein [Cronobacter sakazakii]EKY3152961.1 hypothetical protein [Cronobacter sakazakii]